VCLIYKFTVKFYLFKAFLQEERKAQAANFL